MSKYLKMAAGIVVALGVIVSATLAVESRYAKEVQVAGLAMDMQQGRIESAIDRTQERIWTTEDRLRQRPNDPDTLRRLEELRYEKQRLEERRKELKAK